jgi:hypothetical protein
MTEVKKEEQKGRSSRNGVFYFADVVEVEVQRREE